MASVKPQVLLAVSLLAAPLFSNLPTLAGAAEDALHLELASVVFRHGDRSPITPYPNDHYKESDWPQGFGQLSKTGMQQQYHLGELLKARYIVDDGCSGLVCSNYTRVQIRIQSTDVDRTLMSAEAQLSALFPPGPDQNFSSFLLWQPIPIHTVPFGEDELLRPLDVCPAYDALREQDKNSSAYKDMEAKYKDFFDEVGKKAGVMPLDLSNTWSLQDTLFIENASSGYETPNWVNDSVLTTLGTIADFSMTLMFNSKEKNRLSAGKWLGKILYDMKNKSNPNGNQTVEDMKLFFYSAHDTTVAAMTSALQVFSGQQPGYATAFAVELYSDTNKNYFVKMFRRDGPFSDTFNLLNVSFCKNSNLCTLQEFESFVTPLIPSDLAAECGSVPTTSPPITITTQSPNLQSRYQSLKIVVIALGSVLSAALLISIVLIVVLVTVFLKKMQSAKRIYSALGREAEA